MTRAFVLLLVSCALVGPARADEEAIPAEPIEEAAAEPSLTVVYSGVDPGPVAAGQAGALVEILTGGKGTVATPIHHEEMFPGGGIEVHGAPVHQLCEGPPVTAATYRDRVYRLYQATTQLQDTTGQADKLKANQACLTDAADPAELARVPFLQGVTAFGDGDTEAAQAAFTEVFVIDPDYAWDPEYPPDAQLAFANAGTAAMRLGFTDLRVEAPLGAQLLIDGRPSSPTGALQVIPGRHLVQLRAAADQPMRGAVIDVPAEGGALVLSLAGLDSADGPQASMSAINGARQDTDAETIDWFVQLWPTLAAWTWDPQTRTVGTENVPPSAAATVFGTGPTLADKRARKSRTVPIVMGAGAALVVAGAVITGASSNKANGITSQVEEGLPFVHPDDAAPTDEQQANAEAFNRARTTAGVGVGLMAAGGVALGITIPLKIRLDRAEKEADVSVSAMFDAPLPGEQAPSGFGLRVTIR
jgi:hypothetical protein